MTLRQFEYLSEQDQERVLQTKAVHIASFIDNKAVCTLFQIDSFYLEIQSSAADKYRTACFFDEPDLLEPYLELINIDPVYSLLGYRRND